jgi:ribosome recycling factor
MSAVVIGIPQILTDAKSAMDKAVDSARRDFSSVRTGKATSNLLDTIRVEAYGQSMPLNQLASVAAPEPRLLTVTPWDKGQAKAIEKAIAESDLGLNPSNQGGVIRVPLPQLNEQRRKDLVKVIHKMAEDGRIAVRHARTEGRDKLKKLDKVSEDDVKTAERDLQKAHDDFIGRIDELVKTKEADILEV